MNDELLKGVRIIEFGSFLAGPVSSMILAQMGAEVIKIENRKKPDGARFFVQASGRPPANPKYGENFFDVNNLDKKSLTVDVSTQEGKEIIKRLAAKSDIFLENMSPGVVTKLKIDYEEIKKVNPEIIYMSSSACGQTGPEKSFRGYASQFACKAGVGDLTGYVDGPPSGLVGSVDVRSATMATIAMLVALNYRESSGKGQYIDLSSQEAIAAQLGDVYLDYILNGEVQTRAGNHRIGFAPNNTFTTIGEDEWVSISCSTDEEWKALCICMGKPELAKNPKYIDYNSRFENQEEMDEIINAWTKGFEKYEITKLLQKNGVPAAPSLNCKDVIVDKHVVERKSYTTIDHPNPDLKQDVVTTPPWNFSKTPVEVSRHAPILSEHSEEILSGILGMSENEINRLIENEVV